MFLLSIIYLLTAILHIIPNAVRVTSLPFGLDPLLVQYFGYLNAFLGYVWFLQVVWQMFIWYLLFKFIILTLKLMRIIR